MTKQITHEDIEAELEALNNKKQDIEDLKRFYLDQKGWYQSELGRPLLDREGKTFAFENVDAAYRFQKEIEIIKNMYDDFSEF